jgi:hypothetical protein
VYSLSPFPLLKLSVQVRVEGKHTKNCTRAVQIKQ